METYLICSAILVLRYFLMSGTSGWITWVVILVTVSRVLHAAGMLMTARVNGPPHVLRALGSAGTLIGGFMLGIALLMRAAL
ncbi:MAG: hypothetical protein ABIT36_05320 [Steroidobacteraceae bacterium]